MKFKDVIGIDVGKLSNELRIHSSQKAFTFKNTRDGCKSMFKWIIPKITCKQTEVIFAFEHTGIYSLPLIEFFAEHKLYFTLIPGLDIKRSLGIQRGKNDKIDAKRIALYAYRKREELNPYKVPLNNIVKLRRLLSLREKLVVQKAGYDKIIQENKTFLKKSENRVLFEVQEKIFKELSMHIKKVEKELDSILSTDSIIIKQYMLITSIKGVGRQTALYMIAYTNGFTLFESWRKFASYAGTAPFPFQSGISINGRTKVSHLANKKLKSLLNMCATSAIICNPEMKAYFQRKKKEGKNGMCVINAVRNKMLARIFAVIMRGTPYIDTHKFAA